jgi:hypothetical protein
MDPDFQLSCTDLKAILRALETAPEPKGPLEIRTDSRVRRLPSAGCLILILMSTSPPDPVLHRLDDDLASRLEAEQLQELVRR